MYDEDTVELPVLKFEEAFVLFEEPIELFATEPKLIPSEPLIEDEWNGWYGEQLKVT